MSSVEERLTSIDNKLTDLIEFKGKLEEHMGREEKVLWGNGQEGIVTQVAKLVQAEKRMFWLVGVVFADILTNFGPKLWHMVL